ncbi:MAG TPA: sulfite exporter TauE/SafE family protein [Streptosporangiaceae bacterium]|nr:sulfite exporter TauE/SafE family protein [Streptosporangiaceae bacterium]
MVLPLAVIAGLLIGLTLGALGGGGSILAVPALVYLLGESPHQAVSASLLVVGVSAVFGAIAHARAGRVRLKEGAAFGLLGIAGSYAGSRVSAAVPAQILLAGFGLLMLVVAVAMIARRRSGNWAGPHADSRPSGPNGGPREAGDVPAAGGRHPVLIGAAATGVGLVTGFFGVGGGFVIVPALVLMLGFDMPAAAGTSLMVIAIDSGAALAARASHGGLVLDWATVGVFAAAVMAGTLAGGRAAGRARPAFLSAAFSVVVVVVACYTLARSLPGLA